VKIITCPHCGEVVATLKIGRPPTNVSITDICDALRLCHSVRLAAEKLVCSRALVYKVMKADGLAVKDFIKKEEANGKPNR